MYTRKLHPVRPVRNPNALAATCGLLLAAAFLVTGAVIGDIRQAPPAIATSTPTPPVTR